MKKSILFFALMLFYIGMYAQSGKLNAALQKITQSDFIISFDSIASTAENAARIAKNQPFTPEEMTQLQITYDAAIAPLNNLLLNMKKDLMDGKKIKLMLADPQVYGDSYQLRLQEAYKKYQNSFLPLKAELEIKHNIGDVPLVAIISIINGAYELFKKLRDIKNDLKKFTDQLLQQQFVEPHAVKSWQEL